MKIKYIMLFLGLAVAGCAAYFSVWGLGQLFAGASVSVIIMGSILEIGKIVTTTALHTYWDKLAKGLRVYLTLSVVILMLITSAGIYGFLSNAYQKTANKLEIYEGELGVLDAKKIIFEKKVIENQKIIEGKTKRIDQLSNLRTNQELRLDGSTTNRNRNAVRRDIETSNTEIQKLNDEIDLLNVKNSVLADSISVYNIKALELKSGSNIAGEVGPLKYISSLTGIPMANVVNYMILLLIFVFDPLAVALVLITNRIFLLENTKVVNEAVNEVVNEAVNEVVNPIFENIVEPIDEVTQKNKKEPVVPKGKIQLEDIKEIKEGNRGFSVNIPKPKNMIERIGTNKLIKDGDNNKIYFKRDDSENK